MNCFMCGKYLEPEKFVYGKGIFGNRVFCNDECAERYKEKFYNSPIFDKRRNRLAGK